MLKNLVKWLKKKKGHKVISRAEHGISRTQISQSALKVLYRLHKAGFKAYLVGGCIRDLLLGLQPKDFDIATNAEPEQVKELFSNCRLIGRRFRLAHVHFGREIVEVATFRAQHADVSTHSAHGMILRDNVYGTIEEDVLRRDFTVNSLYYNIANFSIEDFVDGIQDLKKREIVLIGNPEQRYREDPVRMLRAIRFAAKLGFSINPTTAQPIYTHGHLLANVPAARLFEEFMKLFMHGYAYKTFTLLQEYNLLSHLFPRAITLSAHNSFVEQALRNTDQRVNESKNVSPSFLLAVFLWPAMVEQAKINMENGNSEFMAYHNAMDRIFREQQRVIAVPRSIVNMARDIWEMQLRLQKKRSPGSAAKMSALAKFRAGYDFLVLRAEAGDKQVAAIAKWWSKYAEFKD